MINPWKWFLLQIGRCPFCRRKLIEKERGGITKLATIIWYVTVCPKCGVLHI